VNKKIQAVILLFVSVLGFAAVQSIVKFIGPSVTSWAKAFYRSLFGFIFLAIWMIIKRHKYDFNNYLLLILRGVSGTLSLICVFWAIDLIDLSHATFYLYTYPVFAPLFSSIIFKEKFKKIYFIPILLSLIGLYLLISPENNALSIYDLFGILSGIFAGFAISCVKELRKINQSEDIYFFFCVAAIVFSFFAILIKKDQSFVIFSFPGKSVYFTVVILIVLGFFATVAQVTMTEAYKYVPTAFGSVVSLLTMPIVAVIAIVYFKEPFTYETVFGGVIIFTSAILATYFYKKIV